MKLFDKLKRKNKNADKDVKVYKTDADRAREEEISEKISNYQRKKMVIRLAILCGIFAVAAVMAVLVWNQVKPEAPSFVTFEPMSSDGADSSPGLQSPGIGIGEDENLAPAEAPLEQTAGRKEGFYTFVVVGEDQGTGNTDTIIVGAYDSVNKKLTAVNIPRDTMVNVSWSAKKASTIYYLPNLTNSKIPDGYTREEYLPIHRVNNLQTQIKNLTGFTPDSYFVVSLDAFTKLVDAIGGVTFDIPYKMDYDDPYQDLHIHFNKGTMKLTGKQAMEVARFRHTASADIGRIEVQQNLVKAIAKQAFTLSNVTKIGEFAKIFEENVYTNLTLNNMTWYANEFLQLDMDTDIEFVMVPENYGDSVNGISYCSIYLNDWLEIINEKLNPFTTEIGVKDVNILTRKGGKDSPLYATNGTIAGGVDSFYNPRPGGSSTATATPKPTDGGDSSATPKPTDGGDTPEPTDDPGLFFTPPPETTETTPTPAEPEPATPAPPTETAIATETETGGIV
ncbi:MAG: LCP family protein [Oscillospiraceae bacterium]|nr:LCP family protein [Oscillospiraceae bacterium]